MSVRPIFVLLKTNADFLFLLEIGMSGEWKDDNSGRVVEKTRQIMPFHMPGERMCTKFAVQECHILSSLSLPLQLQCKCCLCFACPAAGHFHTNVPDLPEPKLRQPCTEYTWDKKQKGGNYSTANNPPFFLSPFLSLSLKVDRERKNPGRTKYRGKPTKNRPGVGTA